MSESGYEPPPPFAPPPLRVAPLNEAAVLGRTSYPDGPYAAGRYQSPGPYQHPPAYHHPPAPGGYPPPDARHAPTAWQPRHLEGAARRRRVVSILTGMAVVTALVAICAVLLSREPAANHPHSLTLPTAVDNYSRINTLSGSQVRSMFAAGGGTFGAMSPADLEGARIGLYASLDDTAPTMLFVGFTGHDSPTVGARLRSGPAARVADEVLSGAHAQAAPTSADAGPLGGAMRCANVVLSGGEAASVGVWADADTLGIVVLVDPTLSTRAGSSAARTGAVTRDFRAKAEH